MDTKKTDSVIVSELVYPDSDGEPMSDHEANTDRMVDARGALRLSMRLRGRKAFVGMDHFVYPVEGEPLTRNAPDVFVAPGCEALKDGSKRPSFKYWEEEGTVDFAGEFLSPIKHEKLDSPGVLERVEFYRLDLCTRELFLYEPLGIDPSAGFRFKFLRMARQGSYKEVRPAGDGWYTSRVLDLELRPTNERVEFRDPRTKEIYPSDLQRAERESERAERESERAKRERRARLEAEARIRELEERLREREGGARTDG